MCLKKINPHQNITTLFDPIGHPYIVRTVLTNQYFSYDLTKYRITSMVERCRLDLQQGGMKSFNNYICLILSFNA